MTFNPQEHLSMIGKKEYLEVRWRLVWFREAHPTGQILTDLVNVEPVVVKATIIDKSGAALATGYGSANDTGKAVWSGRGIEKAETAAIGRALAHAGFGTQFTEDDEGDHLADSPMDTTPAKPKNITPISKDAEGSTSTNPRRFNDNKPTTAARPTWDTANVLEQLRNWCMPYQEITSDDDIAKLALIVKFTDIEEWRKTYPTPDDAFRFIKLSVKTPAVKA